MTQIIVYANENGGVSVTTPSAEFLENNTINDVLNKDCPNHAIIIDNSELPQGEDEFFNAWELVNGQVVVNQNKKQQIIAKQEAETAAKESALSKLTALGLTADEVKALLGIA